MKATLILHLAVLGLVGAEAGPKVLEFELSKVAVAKDEPAAQGELAERDMSLLMLTDGLVIPGEYTVSIQVGDPGQTVRLGVHTVGSVTWIAYRNDSMTHAPYQGFDRGKSETFHLVKNDSFTLKRFNRPDICGEIIRETVALNPNSKPTLDMALGAIQQDEGDVIGGLGLAARGEHDQFRQPTFLEYLHTQRLISRRAFSLYFDPDNRHGRVLFGGVDTTRFTGELTVVTRLPNPSDRKVEGFFVGLSGVDIVIPTSEPFQVSMPAEGMASLLDSSFHNSYLPQEILSKIAAKVGASFNENSVLMINCTFKDQPNPQERITFTLPRADGGTPVRINIPLADLVLARMGPGYCLFGIQPISRLNSHSSNDNNLADVPTTGFAVFGQNFLRHIYMVGDIDSNQIAVAPINLGPTRPANIVELKAFSAGIPPLRGVDSLDKRGQAPPRAPEDGMADMEVD